MISIVSYHFPPDPGRYKCLSTFSNSCWRITEKKCQSHPLPHEQSTLLTGKQTSYVAKVSLQNLSIRFPSNQKADHVVLRALDKGWISQRFTFRNQFWRSQGRKALKWGLYRVLSCKPERLTGWFKLKRNWFNGQRLLRKLQKLKQQQRWLLCY